MKAKIKDFLPQRHREHRVLSIFCTVKYFFSGENLTQLVSRLSLSSENSVPLYPQRFTGQALGKYLLSFLFDPITRHIFPYWQRHSFIINETFQ